MSNTDNIYNILNNFNKIAKEEPAPVAATPKAKTKLQESMEQVVNEKYMGFKKTVAAIKKSGSAKDPEAVAAAIGRKKHGKEKFQKAAATGKKLGEDHGPENPDALVNYGEYDREGDMAKDDLYTIDNAAEELYSILRTDDNLPEWVQKKITLAVDYLDTARDYMKAQSYGQGMAEGSGDPEITPGMKTQYGTVVKVNGNTVTVKASNGELTTMNIHDIQQAMAEGVDDKFRAADKVVELVRYYKLHRGRDWFDLFEKIAGKKLYGTEMIREIDRANEYASKFLDLNYRIAMRYEYRGKQDPRNDQELIDLSNQWLDLLDQAENEFKTMSGQGMSEGMVKGEYGRVLDALQLYYPRLSMEELNVPGYHKVVADKANVPVEYAAQVINDFVRDNDPDEDEFDDDEQAVAEGYDPAEHDYYGWSQILQKDGYRNPNVSGADALKLVAGDYRGPDGYVSTIRNILTYVKQNRQVLGKAVSDRKTVKDAIIDIRNEFPKLYQAAQQPQGVAEDEFDESIRNKLAAAALAGTMALGAGGAQAKVIPGVQDGFASGFGGKPVATQMAPSTSSAPAAGSLNAQSAASREVAKQARNAADQFKYTNPSFAQEYKRIETTYEKIKSIVYNNKRSSSNDTDLAKRQHAESIKTLIAADMEFAKDTNALMKQYGLKEQGMSEASFPTVADARKRAEQEKGTGKFTSKKNPDNPSGTFYTRKYNPKSGETDDTENVSTEKRGRGRPKKSAFEDMSTIDKMIAEAFGELFEGTSRPVGDPVSKAAPTAPGVGSGIRVTPMPALATTPKPAPGMGSIQGGVWTAKPPKAGEQGVPVPQGIDEGPLLDKIGTGIGKAAGSIVGGAANFGQAIKKGYQAGKSGDDDERAAASAAADTAATRSMGQMAPDRPPAPSQGMDLDDPSAPYPALPLVRPRGMPDLDEADAEMEGMRKLAGLKGGQKKLDRDQDGELTRNDFRMLRKGLEEGGRDDYDEIRDKIQWLQGAPNYLSRDEAKETAYYTKDTDPVWDGYRDDAGEVGENLEVRANPAGASSAEQAKKIGAQFPQQNGKEPNLAYKIGEDEVEENLIVVPNPSGAGSVAAAKKLGAMMPAKPGEKDPISTNEDDMEEGNVITKAMADKTIPVGAPIPGTNLKKTKHLDTMAEGDAALNQMRRIAGLKEGGMSPISGMASDMEKQQGSMNISTNQSSDGTKSVTITANGDAASDLMQMLKLAGMSGGGAAPAAAAEPEIVVVAQDGEETMEEEKDPRYQASTTPDEQVAPVQALTKGGNGDVAGQEKTMKPGGYQFGDNNLAMQESLSAQLMKEYNSIKVKK